MALKDSLKPKVASLSVGLMLGTSILSPIVQAETLSTGSVQNVPQEVQKGEDTEAKLKMEAEARVKAQEQKAKAEAEKQEREKAEKAKAEQERQLQEEHAKKEQADKERAEAEKQAKEKAEQERKAQAEQKAKEKADADAKAEQERVEKEKAKEAELEAQKKADEEALKQAKEIEEKDLKEMLDIEGDFFNGGEALPDHLKNPVHTVIFPRYYSFMASPRAFSAYSNPRFTPYDVPNPSGWGAVHGDNDQFNPQGGNNLSYNVYTEDAGNKEGLKVVQEKFPGKMSQRYLTFSGFAIQKGYSNHYEHNQRTYIGLVNSKGEEKFYSTEVQSSTDATRDFTYGYGTKYQPRQCRDDEYNQWSDEGCTMNYKGVGFKAHIPLDDLFGDAKRGNYERSYKVKIYHMVKGNGGSGSPHFVWNWVKVPINKLDLGSYTSFNEATGVIDFKSGRGTNSAQVNTPDHIRRTAPASAGGDCPIGTPCRYFKQGVNYPIIGTDQTRTVVWYKYGKQGNEPNDSWGQSQYFKLTGEPATITFRTNSDLEPVKDAKVKVKYVFKGSGQLYKEELHNAVRGKKYELSVPRNTDLGTVRSNEYVDTMEKYGKGVYGKDSFVTDGNGGVAFVNQTQNYTIVPDTEKVEEATFYVEKNENPNRTWDSRVMYDSTYSEPLLFKNNEGTGYLRSGVSEVRYFDTPVLVQYIDADTKEVIREVGTRVIPYGSITLAPVPSGKYFGGGTSYLSMPENKEVTVKSGYVHPGNEAPKQVVVKYYYKKAKPDPSDIVDNHEDIPTYTNVNYSWFLEKETSESKSKLVVQSLLANKFTDSFYAVRNVQKVVETADDKEHKGIINEKTKDGFQIIADDRNGDGRSDATSGGQAVNGVPNVKDINLDSKKEFEPNDLKGRKLSYKYELEGTHTYYNRYVCTWYDNVYDKDGNKTEDTVCVSWSFVERIPLWGDGTDKVSLSYWDKQKIRKQKIQLANTLDVDHKYGEDVQFQQKKINLTTGRNARMHFGSVDTVSIISVKSEANEEFNGSGVLLFNQYPTKERVAVFPTQQPIDIGGTIYYKQKDTLGDKSYGGLTKDQISYDRNMLYVDKNGNRTKDKSKDVDGRANNGVSGFYVGDVDKNLKEQLHVVKTQGSPEKDRKGDKANFFKLPVSVSGTNGQFTVRTSDDYYVFSKTGFQFAYPKLAYTSDYPASDIRVERANYAKKEYEKAFGVKTDDNIVNHTQPSSKYYMPIAVDTKGDAKYGFTQMKPNEIQETELTIGSLGLNDVVINIPFKFKFDSYLVGSTMDRDKDGKDVVYVAEQNEGISKKVNYDQGYTVRSKDMEKVQNSVGNVEDVKVNTFRNGNTDGLRKALRDVGIR